MVCAIDLDTILPCYFASLLRRKKRIYDAHELFTEQKEIVTRPRIYKFWLVVEKFAVPRFQHGYTVNRFIADELKRRYGVHYTVIRNLPELIIYPPARAKNEERFIIYQGAVNEGRSFETLIPAMKFVDARLKIYGNGNFFEQVKELIKQHNVEDKAELKGAVVPDELKSITPGAYIAVMLFEQTGLNQYHSLSNRFFDYIMAGVPQVCINYPEYKTINDEFQIALMIDDTAIDSIASALNRLLQDNNLHEQLSSACVNAAKVLNWKNEESKLLKFYRELTLKTNKVE
jgi:glycosyltransferase involved in cell wall biosynthesis